MGAMDALGKANEIYKEILTTSARFDDLRHSTEQTLARLEQSLEKLVSKVSALHDDHVRETAALRAEIRALEARLSGLSEHAIHAVAREVAEKIMRESIETSKNNARRKRPRARLTGGA